jgi:hypothetical protein
VRRLVAALLAATTLTVAAPAHACACGGVLDQPGADTAVSNETALVVWEGASETILLRLSTRSEAVHAGLLVPTPTAASVSLGDERVFGDLARVTQAREETRWSLFGPPLLRSEGDGGSAGGPPGGVDVIRTVDLGPLRATTLTAADATALNAWMRANHYQSTSDMQRAVQPYIDEGWSFVAVQLNAASATLDGDLPPIEMTFASDRAVYPMRMSSVAAESQQPTVYVLAAHRMERTDPVALGATRPDLRFAGRISRDDVTSPALEDWLGSASYLTLTTQWLPDPSLIVSDFTFGRAPDDTPYQAVVYDDTYLLPGDLGALLILVLVGGAVWLVVRLLRRRRVPAPVSRDAA